MDNDIDALVTEVNDGKMTDLDELIDSEEETKELAEFQEGALRNNITLYAGWNVAETQALRTWMCERNGEVTYKYIKDDVKLLSAEVIELDKQITLEQKNESPSTDRLGELQAKKREITELIIVLTTPSEIPNVEGKRIVPRWIKSVTDLVTDIEKYHVILNTNDPMHIEYEYKDVAPWKSVFDYYTAFCKKIPDMPRIAILYYSILYFYNNSQKYRTNITVVHNSLKSENKKLVAYTCKVDGVENAYLSRGPDGHYHGRNLVGRWITIMAHTKMIDNKSGKIEAKGIVEDNQHNDNPELNPKAPSNAKMPRTPQKQSKRITPILISSKHPEESQMAEK